MPAAAEPRGLLDGGTSHAVAVQGKTSALSAFKPTISPDIIDIRHAAVELNLKEEILSMLHPQSGPRQLPTLLLYDENGLQLFEKVGRFPATAAQAGLRFAYADPAQITYLKEYYLTNDEIEVLESSAVAIAREIPDGAMVIELGSG